MGDHRHMMCGTLAIIPPDDARAVGREHRVGEAGAVVAHDGARVRKERHLGKAEVGGSFGK